MEGVNTQLLCLHSNAETGSLYTALAALHNEAHVTLESASFTNEATKEVRGATKQTNQSQASSPN